MPDGDESDIASAVDGDSRPAPARRADLVSAWIERHPLLLVVLIASAVGAAHTWWIWRHRHLGGFDPDEASYLSASLRIQRSIDLGRPVEVIRSILTSGNGIAAPSLSVPLLIVGPRDPRMAMMLQPLLMVAISVSVAGITRRIAGSWAAIVAGAAVVALPTMITATQSYWYGLSAAAAMCGAVWALLESDRGSNRRVWWFGIGLGLTLLSRTMTLGFLPVCVLAGVVYVWPDRRSVRRVLLASALGVAMAAPWYVLNRRTIFEYLLSYGYGPRAELFGEAGLGDRFEVRRDRMINGLGGGPWLWVVVALAVVGVAPVLFSWLRTRDTAGWPARSWLVLVIIVAGGSAALLSTANNGVWFELPLVVLTVPLLASAVARIRRPVGAGLSLVVVAVAAVNLAAGLWIRPFEESRVASHYEWGFAEYDERFVPTRRDEHATASRDWWELSVAIERAMKRISPTGRTVLFSMSGNTHLYNANTIRMVAELDGWDPEFLIPDTTASSREREADLTPTAEVNGHSVERVLVVAVHDQILWPIDRDVDSFLAQARRRGFTESKRFRMPRGGDVMLLRHVAR